MESHDYYRCSKCPIVGPAREMEAHLAEHHIDYRPYHCHTWGRRAYDRSMIADGCGSHRHNLALWEAREEAKEGQLVADLKTCLNLPVVVTEQKATPQFDAVSVTVAAPAGGPLDSGIFAADSSSIAPVTQKNTDHSGTQAMEADAAETTAVGTTPSGTSQPKKRPHDSTVYTVMTCRYIGCGAEIALSGAVPVSEQQKRHVQKRHLWRPSQNIHCPMVGCAWAARKSHFSAYDRSAIADECGSRRHNVALWEAREEAKEGHLAASLKKCLNLPVVVTQQKVAPQFDAVTVTIEALSDGPPDSGIFAADSNSIALENNGQSSTQTLEADAAGATAVGATHSGTSQPKKRPHDSTVHAVMTCHYTGCGEELVLRGSVALSDEQKRHVKQRHLQRPSQNIHCPVVGCAWAAGKKHFSYMHLLGTHLQRHHGGLGALSVKQHADYRTTQKRVLDASLELIPVCFPPGAVTRNKAAARSLHQAQKRHIERCHMESGTKIACPMEGCGKTWDTLVSLEWHICKYHEGLAGLNAEQKAEYLALKKRRNAAIDAVFGQHFPDDG